MDLLRTRRARAAERMLAVGHALTDGDLVYCDDAGQPRVRPGAVVMSWWVYSTPLWYARHAVGLRPVRVPTRWTAPEKALVWAAD